MAASSLSNAFLNDARVAPDVFQLRRDYRTLLMVDGIVPSQSDSTSESLLQEAEAPARDQSPGGPDTTCRKRPAPCKSPDGHIQRHLSQASNSPRRKDLDKYEGSPRLICAVGDERFEIVTSGETVLEYLSAGEVVWCDDFGVTCPRWNWRQGPRTALTDNTKRALFILNALDPVSNETLMVAADELASVLKQLGIESQTTRLSKHQ